MKIWKRALSIAVLCVTMAVLVACQDLTKDATVFVQGELDATYLGQYSQECIDVVEDMTEADAQEKYDYNVSAEADILMTYLAIEMPTEQVTQRAQDLVAEIYSHAKYTVADAEKLKSGDLAVEVTVSPIEIIPLLTSDFMNDTWNSVLESRGITTQEQLDAQFQEADEEYAMALLDELERLIPEITYGEDQVIMLQMKEDEDGYYSLVESGLQKVDEVMIDYYGSYAE